MAFLTLHALHAEIALALEHTEQYLQKMSLPQQHLLTELQHMQLEHSAVLLKTISL